jgi:hypothetical protein
VNGARVGLVTSVAPLIDQDLMTALAYVKTEAAELGWEYEAVVGDETLLMSVLMVPGEG